MSDDDNRKISVSKLEAAKRQLDCAIELWFRGGDEVSTYTLAAAAHQIIEDINKHRGTGFETVYETRIIQDEYRQMWRALVRDPVNFLKHADRDPEGTVELAIAGILLFFVYAVHGLGYLQSQSSDQERSLFVWLLIHKPNFIREDFRGVLQDAIPVEHIGTLRGLPKEQFFEHMMNAARDFRLGK